MPLPLAFLLFDLHKLLHENVEWSVAAALLALWLFSGMVRSVPEPTADSGKLYRFVYNWAHWVGANWDKAPLPGASMLTKLTSFLPFRRK